MAVGVWGVGGAGDGGGFKFGWWEFLGGDGFGLSWFRTRHRWIGLGLALSRVACAGDLDGSLL